MTDGPSLIENENGYVSEGRDMDCLPGAVFNAKQELMMMDEIEKQVLEVIHNLNWLLEAHDSRVELIRIEGNVVTVRCAGYCNECETDCIGVAFKERMPDIVLIRKK